MPAPRAKKTASRAAHPAQSVATAPLVFIWGGDDYAVKQRARQVFSEWQQSAGEFDQETIDGAVETVDQVQRALAQVREAMQSLPFFGGDKVVWLKNCSFLGEGRLSELKRTKEVVAGFAADLQQFAWDKVRLLISAGKVDRRRGFYKTVTSIGAEEVHAGLSGTPGEWVPQAEKYVRDALAAHGQRVEPAALHELIVAVGPNLRALASETEKLSLHADGRDVINRQDIDLIISATKQAEAFAVAEALGDRDLPRALQTLDEELWQIRTSRSGSPIGLVLGLISKVRVLLLVKELVRLRHLRTDLSYNQVGPALKRLPADLLPNDKRFNPALMHPFPVFKALGQCRHYALAELREAMDRLLLCNLRLVSSSLDNTLEIQSALIEIVGRETAQPSRRSGKAAGRGTIRRPARR